MQRLKERALISNQQIKDRDRKKGDCRKDNRLFRFLVLMDSNVSYTVSIGIEHKKRREWR